MTLDGWLDARRPAPPAALVERVRSALDESLTEDAANAPEACLRASERLVRTLLQTDSTTRHSALDLLAADALVTYAFEAASEHPDRLVALASDAMMRMATLAGVESAPASR
jgi:hypothetical protein